jgi:hypothetical protein
VGPEDFTSSVVPAGSIISKRSHQQSKQMGKEKVKAYEL